MNKDLNSFEITLQERILGLYSEGEEYENITKIINDELGIDLAGRKLGYKMGSIKKKMGCKTQFQMGYIYAQQQAQQKINRSFEEGRKTGFDQAKIIITGKGLNKGLNIGIITSTIFWLSMMAFAYGFIQ